MIVDSSALIAILRGEPDAPGFLAAIARADAVRVSAVTLFEASMVTLSRQGETGVRELHALLNRGSVEIVPFDAAQAGAATEAFRRFGKGRHPAGLNLGDCCAYALAATMGEALLFKGADFARTGIRPAV